MIGVVTVVAIVVVIGVVTVVATVVVIGLADPPAPMIYTFLTFFSVKF